VIHCDPDLASKERCDEIPEDIPEEKEIDDTPCQEVCPAGAPGAPGATVSNV